MNNVFRVTIHYHNHGEIISKVNVIASDDVKARTAALVEKARDFKENLLKMPKIEYCEIEFICKAVSA